MEVVSFRRNWPPRLDLESRESMATMSFCPHISVNHSLAIGNGGFYVFPPSSMFFTTTSFTGSITVVFALCP